MSARLLGFLLLAAAAIALAPVRAAAQRFEGRAAITQLSERTWELLEDLHYYDSRNETWKAPKGYVTDGASIPWPLWSIIGAPFEGKYVKSAIIHDVYCDLKSRPWKIVHRTFYDAMIADGVPALQAKIMYYAVARFGPRWIVAANLNCPFGYVCNAPDPVKVTLTARPIVDVQEFNDSKKEIESGDISIEEIERKANEGFYASRNLIRIDGQEERANGSLRILDQIGRLGPHLRRAMPSN